MTRDSANVLFLMKSYTECNPLTFLINEKRKIKKLYAGNFVVPENQKVKQEKITS